MNIQIIGLGKLGLPLALVLAKHFNVYGVDKNEGVVRKISQRISPIDEPGVAELLKQTKLQVGIKYKKNVDITFVIVPTPSRRDGSFSNRYIDEALDGLGGTIVITSTVMPGTCETRTNKKINLLYNPLFIALGSVIENLENPDFVLIGSNGTIPTKLLHIWNMVCLEQPFVAGMNLLEAEITKLVLNCYITMKITFANHLAEILDDTNASAKVICRAIGRDSRIVNKFISPGLGFGGPCFPRDNRAFQAFAKQLGKKAEMAKLVDTINDRQVDRIVEKVRLCNPKWVGFKYLSYKENTNVLEGSQLLLIYGKLKKLGYKVKVGEGDITIDNFGIRGDNDTKD